MLTPFHPFTMALAATAPQVPFWAWLAFLFFIGGMLALDLGIFQRRDVALAPRTALGWCAVWVAFAAVFALVIAGWLGREAAEQFTAGYIVELCLSVDNIFIFIVLFNYFKVPREYQHRVLFWGIIGAVFIRTIFIVVGVGIVAHFHYILYAFGALLIYTAIRLLQPARGEVITNPEGNFVVRVFRRLYPVTTINSGRKFFVRENGRPAATPLFLVLLVIETTDVIFAVDSIPAVLTITHDAFIALSSNVFAILGLRSLYFAVSGIMRIFRFLKFGLAAILGFIGTKMLLESLWFISTGRSLVVIAVLLTLSIVISLIFPERASIQAEQTRAVP